MGYSYYYPEIQTADYTIKFIHNDFLQQAVDTGIISMFMLIYLFASNIVSKKCTDYQKEILVIMILHMLLEFDMQFLVIHLIFVMLLEEKEGKIKCFKIKKAKLTIILLTIIQISIFSYFGISSFSEKYGNYEVALNLLPNKTNSKIQKLKNVQNISEAYEIANELLKDNKYVLPAYMVKANYAYYTENWEQMVENQKRVISLDKYDIKNYEEYIYIISNGLEKTIKQNKNEDTKFLIEQALNVVNILEEVKKNTSQLAYKIIDKPELELNEATKQYLNVLENFD